MKRTISWNYFNQNMMMIFWMLTFICSILDCWSNLLQNPIQYILCCFINTEELMLQSQIAYHTFKCLSQPRPLWNWLTETRDMPKELELFNVVLLNVELYIQWDQFIIVQVTFTKPYHWVPSNFMLFFQNFISETIEHCDFVDPKGCSWRSYWQTQII